MKLRNIFYSLVLGAVASVSFQACSDFDEVNTDPFATSADKVKPYWLLSKAIIQDQQNPNDAERVFVLYWGALSRQDGESVSGGIACGGGNDEWRGCEYNLVAKALTYTNAAINLCDANFEAATAHEQSLYGNIKQFSRIYRAYLLSEFSDCFGPTPINAGQGNDPTFNSVKEVYYYALQELADAADGIDTSVVPSGDEAKCDPVYGWDAAKWKAYAISMRMRLAMRLSECDGEKAKAEFEAAVKQGNGIISNDQAFQVEEFGGWDDWTAVMSRTWNWQSLSATMANLACNLGGAKSVDALKHFVKDATVYESYVKDADNYIGIQAKEIFAEYTDNPTKQYYFLGLPENVDPRALYYFHLPADYYNRKANGYLGGYDSYRSFTDVYPNDNDSTVVYDCSYSWNGLTCGWGYDDVATNSNDFWNGSTGASYFSCIPQLADEFRNCETTKTYRFFFGPWETYFLLAEAAVRGWNAGIGAEQAYNKGIELSLEYNGLGDLYQDYISSESYNRVGTSVKFSHTTEPVATEMDAIDYTTGQPIKVMYQYPDASKILYKGHKLNDALTKIMTQLYIANTPYLPLENWSNHRRLGLPFFEIPVSVSTITYMPAWSQNSYKEAQTIAMFPQRMQYPASLGNADAAGYEAAKDLLKADYPEGGDDSMTPLWWAIGGHK